MQILERPLPHTLRDSSIYSGGGLPCHRHWCGQIQNCFICLWRVICIWGFISINLVFSHKSHFRSKQTHSYWNCWVQFLNFLVFFVFTISIFPETIVWVVEIRCCCEKEMMLPSYWLWPHFQRGPLKLPAHNRPWIRNALQALPDGTDGTPSTWGRMSTGKTRISLLLLYFCLCYISGNSLQTC